MLPMLITVDDLVVSWTGGGGADAVFVHTNPARVRDLEKHGVRHVRPKDPEHSLYVPVVRACLAKAAKPKVS